MKLLVTGGCGMLGRKLLGALLDRGYVLDADGQRRGIERIRVADIAPPANPLPDDDRIDTVYGDATSADTLKALFDGGIDGVFHLAAIVSGEAEQDVDKGYRVNLDGVRHLLEACRAAGNCPRFVFSSSLAAYGGELPEVVQDDTALTPQNSYGVQKAMGELLVHDYSRKGFVDGRALRLPTIVVRPGKPNAAASSFASGIIREPLNGEDAVCPVPETLPLWLLSPRQVTHSFVHGFDLGAAAWRGYRALAIPGLTVTVREMLDALGEVAGNAAVQRVHFEPDAFITGIVGGWPARFAPRRAQRMGFAADPDFRSVIEAFIEDELR